MIILLSLIETNCGWFPRCNNMDPLPRLCTFWRRSLSFCPTAIIVNVGFIHLTSGPVTWPVCTLVDCTGNTQHFIVHVFCDIVGPPLVCNESRRRCTIRIYHQVASLYWLVFHKCFWEGLWWQRLVSSTVSTVQLIYINYYYYIKLLVL